MAKKDKEQQRSYEATTVDGNKVALFVRLPTNEEKQRANIEYASKFNACVTGGIPTRIKVVNAVRKNGMLDKETDSKLAQFRADVLGIEKQLKDKTLTADARAALEGRRNGVMDEFNVLRGEVDSLISQTAESLAEDAKRNFLICCTTYRQDSNKPTRLFSSVDELEDAAEEDNDFVGRVTYEYMMFEAGLPSRGDDVFKKAAPETQEEPEATQEPPAGQETPPEGTSGPAKAVAELTGAAA
jgi:hypothetical protein